ncbi:MAG: cupin domain-containing protein [Anaerovoracaceae bacterium]|jgi:mannose-6-phosphate isomerase-like protein (cupin superfamily)
MDKVQAFDISEREWQELKEGLKVCVFRASSTITLQYTEFDAGVVADAHHHPAAAVLYIETGTALAKVGDKTLTLGPGCFINIPSDVVHEVTNIGNRKLGLIEIFTPEREDRPMSKKVTDLGHGWDED